MRQQWKVFSAKPDTEHALRTCFLVAFLSKGNGGMERKAKCGPLSQKEPGGREIPF